MFGEYAQIASYLPSSRDSSTSGDFCGSNLPSHLLPTPSIYPPLWPGGGAGVGGSKRLRGHEMVDDRGYVEDFVMVAEFSEIEGPKPVLTIPKDAGNTVDKNALSVKLMAVDHQTSSEGFSISEDTQVVLSDEESGVSAFVHHFVLYDNQARGFVRPYCMVFISTDSRKIMMFYEELSSQFKRAARFLKYGNRLLFVKDLERHLQDLEHTKGYLLNQVGRMRLKDTDKPDSEQSKLRTNAENELYKGLQNIRQSTTEIKDILSILKPILHDRRLESRFRMLEDRAFQHGSEDLTRAEKLSLQEDWFADNLYCDDSSSVGGSLKESTVSPVSLFKSAPSHTPLLVETKKAKRFNSPLRGLHELCSWGAKEGLRKLRCIHEYFKKDAMVLELEKNESRLMEPTNSMVLHGHCVTTNVLSGILMRGSSLCISEDSSSLLMSGEKLKRWPSVASDDTLESFKSVESYLSIQDEENASLYSFTSNNSSSEVTTSASAQDFLSAPTSPMTEEVPFLPAETPQTTASSETTSSCTPGQTITPSETSSSSALHQTTDTNAQDQLSQNGESTNGVSPDSSTLPPQTTLPPPLIDVKEPSDNTTGIINTSCELNGDSTSLCSSTTEVDSLSKDHTDSSIASHQRSQNYDKTLENNVDQKREEKQNGLDHRKEIIENGSGQRQSRELVSNRSATDSGGSAIQKNRSKIADFFPQPRVSETKGFNSSHENSGESSRTLNGDDFDQGSCDASASRMPSFVPIRGLNPGQNIRAVHRKKECSDNNSHSSVSLEKSLESSLHSLDSNKMEFTESFKSIADTISQTDESYCETDTVADSGFNTTVTADSTPSSDSCLWKPRNGVYTSGDVITCLGPGRPGYGIHEVMTTYHNLQSVLFSLMTGRTVLVIGPAKMEVEVTKVVTALSVFLPDTKRKQHCVVDWMNRPLKVTDLTRIRLAGICRSEKRLLDATIPNAVKQYSTLMDVERRIVIGPLYQGTALNSLLQQKKSFRTDAQHVAYIHSWLMEISNKAFIFYHSFCLGEAGGLTQGHGVDKHREQYTATICCLMNRLGVRDHDITIVEYMAEKIKLAQLEPHIWANVEKGSIIHPLAISSRGSQTLRC